MGRRRQDGGGKSQSIFKKKLLRHINSCQIKHPTVDQLVDYLRSTHSEYSRVKLRQFAKNVNDVLEESGSKRPNYSAVEDSVGEFSGSGSFDQLRKKVKKFDVAEEKLQNAERRHLMNRWRRLGGEETNGVCTSDDDEEEETSSSEDAIYGEEFEPEFDLMNSQLQQKYLEKSKGKPLKNEVVEMEVVQDTSKGKEKVDMFREGGKKIGSELNMRKETVGGEPGVDGDNKGSGPRFKDLGGMKKIVEELKMEVIVPLYHPQLPQHLGVKPMSGILFHGPPGCGKTKLAHAIANETGLPFYKVSATEMVSGISGEVFQMKQLILPFFWAVVHLGLYKLIDLMRLYASLVFKQLQLENLRHDFHSFALASHCLEQFQLGQKIQVIEC